MMMLHAAEAGRWVVPVAARLADPGCKAGPGGQLLAGQRLVLAAHSGAPPAAILVLCRAKRLAFHSIMQHFLGHCLSAAC